MINYTYGHICTFTHVCVHIQNIEQRTCGNNIFLSIQDILWKDFKILIHQTLDIEM